MVEFNWWNVLGASGMKIYGGAEEILNKLELHSVEYYGLKMDDDGVRINIPCHKRKHLVKCLARDGVRCEELDKKGIPVFLKKLFKRSGLIVGSIILCIAMYFYGRFVFDIKINGNERLSDKYIMDALANAGFEVGSYIPSIDFDELSNKVPLGYDDISWIFVNMMGNVAYVEVREYKRNEQESEKEPQGATDLVASCDGQIYRFEVSEGIAKVSIGQTVSKGEMLVSGDEKGDKSDYYGRSVGRVYAKVARTLSVEMPFQIEEEREVARILVKKTVKILGIEINLLKNSSNFDSSCDIIEQSRKITLPNNTELPVIITERYAIKKEKVTKHLGQEQVKELAKEKLWRSFSSQLGDLQIIEISTSESINEWVYRISCRVYCIMDIALEVPSVRAEENGKEQN